MISLFRSTPKIPSFRFLIMQKKGMVLLFSFFMLANASAYGQDEDIFGITRKARNPKSDSQMGNFFRNAFEQIHEAHRVSDLQDLHVSICECFHQRCRHWSVFVD